MNNNVVEPGEPWVSFCMSTRRRPEFLLGTLRSIRCQSFPDFEVIICDNDPAGSAKPVVERLQDPRFRYYCNERDLGMIASFNRSLAKARGKYVVMITDDDPIYPEMLQTLKDLAESNPGLGAYSGGCDVLHTNPAIAKLTLHKVGSNSCLAQMPLDSVRTFSSADFPHAFFSGEVDMYLLWSVGMVRREIAQSVGIPDYGSPYMGDFAYTAAILSAGGCAIINRSLGCQTVHDHNFGRKECGELKSAALGFNQFIARQFSQRPDWPQLRPKVENFVGRWVVLHSVFLRQYFKSRCITDHDLPSILKELFRLPYVRKFR